ncbi:ribulose-bisphosphate carboxylase large subunit family protein [Sulfitobacter sp. M368]|uniref:ribulose-bisphosphate carboxylase large subunit family protein n=1 Tax=Sulfitobacter sp. M368 TaxID=2867021 RepID=UPI0021A612C2|nr:ribulose-bisphosphate carboxylase large subunit family protein [Sulfitobacter sp. M368]UWR16410.1 ribulose-bisphosphate carboxylase large subunit family protein [Sulfitobacter sp. M368]
MSDRIEADYLIETPIDPADAAAVMAGEQSSGTFVKLASETPELIERAAARVQHVETIDTVAQPSLPGAIAAQSYAVAKVTLSWPLENLGPSLPNLMATISGNLFELRQFTGLRILDLRVPAAFTSHNPGPKFGIEGTRRLSGVHKRPLIGTIIKPSVGLDPTQTAAMVADLAEAGVDFIKDDELQADGPACPFEDRARAVMEVINLAANRTGRKIMFAFNLTGEVDEMRRRHDLIRDLGGTCVMVSLNSVGLSGMLALARHSELPIHAHRNGWGYLSREPMLGWSYVAWQKFWRLAGADHMHVNGLRNKFCEADESVIRSARACLTPLRPEAPCLAMPVFSSAQTPLQAAETCRQLGSADLIHAAGGGIAGHPHGAAAGVRAMRAAWDAAMNGIPIGEAARGNPALAAAIKAFDQ